MTVSADCLRRLLTPARSLVGALACLLLGALFAGMLIGASESLAMAVFSPAWAPVVSFSVLIVILLWDPDWA